MKEIRQLTKKEQSILQYNMILERVIAGELDVVWYKEIADLYNDQTPEYSSNMQELQKSKTQLARQRIALKVIGDIVIKYTQEEQEAEKKPPIEAKKEGK